MEELITIILLYLAIVVFSVRANKTEAAVKEVNNKVEEIKERVSSTEGRLNNLEQQVASVSQSSYTSYTNYTEEVVQASKIEITEPLVNLSEITVEARKEIFNNVLTPLSKEVLENLTIRELKKIASGKLSNYGKLKKAELIEGLHKFFSNYETQTV